MPIWPLRKAKPAPLAPAATTAATTASTRPRHAETLELQLLRGVVAGRQADFEALYRIYHPRLLRFLAQLTRVPELVDETLDDTMMVVWQRADSFDGRSKLSTWVFGIAYRKAMKAIGRLDLPAEEPGAEAYVEPGPNPEQRLSLAQDRRQLQLALNQLSADHRAVVELCYFHDMSYGEIAMVVGCPAETVKTRMFYARRRLRHLLADFGPATEGEA